jgi:DNA (cytosine-5)-methyltransferase 1
MTLRMIDTFSGIGGFSLAARWLGGIETVQFVEREPFCQRILSKHWPTVPIHDDICTFNPEPHSADIVCGGFPCQDISQAGKGAGLDGKRSGLFYELLRVVRLVGPRYVVLENVAAITHRGMDAVLGALAEAGYDAEWACIPAAAVGACHRRDRWWCVAYPNSSPREERHGWPEAGVEAPLGNDLERLGASAFPMRQRLERPNQLGEGRAPWPAALARLSPDWGGYASEPVLRRGDAGLSGRVDRLKALGNAVVPQVAMIPLARVLELKASLTLPTPAQPSPRRPKRGGDRRAAG